MRNRQRGFIHPGTLAHIRGKARPVEVVPFSIRTSNGSQDVKVSGTPNAGQTPIAVVFIMTRTTGNASQEMAVSTGFYDGTNNFCYTAQDTDGVGTTESNSDLDESDCIKLLNTSATEIVEADGTALITGGVTLNVFNGAGQAYNGVAIFFFDDSGEALAHKFDVADTVNSTNTVTPGFAADVVLPIYIFRAQLGTTNGFGLQSFGFVLRDNSQVCYFFNSEGGQTTSAIRSRVVNNRGACLQGTTTFISFEFGNFTSTTFDVTTRDDGADSDSRMIALSLRMPNAQFHTGIIDTPTSGDLSVTAPGFPAQSALFIPTSAESENSEESNVNAECYAVGAMTADDEAVNIANSEDGQSTTDTESRHHNDRVRSTSTDGAHSVAARYGGETANGFDMNFIQHHSSAKKWPYLAIGRA